MWLPDDERDWLSAHLKAEAAARKAIRTYTVGQAFREPRVLLLTFAYFLHAAVAYTFVFWLPTILKRLTHLHDFRVTVVVSAIYLASLIAMQANGWHSDHVREHRWHTAIPTLLCSACLLAVLVLNPGTWPTVVLLGISNACLLAFVTSFWAIPSAFPRRIRRSSVHRLDQLCSNVGRFRRTLSDRVSVGAFALLSLFVRLHDASRGCRGHGNPRGSSQSSCVCSVISVSLGVLCVKSFVLPPPSLILMNRTP